MEWVISVLLETFTVRELGRGLLIALVLSPAKSLFPALLSHRKSVKSTLSTEVISAGGYVLLYLFARSWLALVCHAVPEPYLVRRCLHNLVLSGARNSLLETG